ncbi:hypothetical protein D3C73_1253950 [compost metagenome]
MKFIVQHQEFTRLLVLRRQLLTVQIMLQRHQLFLGDALCRTAHNCAFYRLTDKASVGHPFGGNLHHESPALRQDLHQSGLRQLDKGFAHRLARNAKAGGDLFL